MNIQTKERFRKMEFLIGDVSEKIVLEVGIAKELKLNPKKRLTLDVDKKYGPDLLCNLNNEEIPLKENSVDVIVAGELMEHLQDPYDVAKEFFRVLKKGGYVVASSPNICSIVNRTRMLFGKLPSYCCAPSPGKSPEKHIVDFNSKTYKEVFEKAGFTIEELTSNGVISRGRQILSKCPPSWGETLVIKAKK